MFHIKKRWELQVKTRDRPTVFPRFCCDCMCPKIRGFGMLNNGKVKNKSACAQQKW